MSVFMGAFLSASYRKSNVTYKTQAKKRGRGVVPKTALAKIELKGGTDPAKNERPGLSPFLAYTPLFTA